MKVYNHLNPAISCANGRLRSESRNGFLRQSAGYCLERAKGDPFVRFHTLHYAGASSKTLMGGGVNATRTAQSSCAVLGALVPELTVKTINLSQYLQGGGLSKTNTEAK